MRLLTALMLAGLLLFTPALLSADEPTFLESLAALLRGADWDEDEITELLDAAGDLPWDRVTGARPAAVAFALGYARARGPVAIDGPETARLALELAYTSMVMQRAGYDDIDIARTAVEGTRATIMELNRHERQPGELFGELIRERVRTTVRERVRADAAQIGRERTHRALRDLDDVPIIGPPPGGPGPGPGHPPTPIPLD